MAKITADTVAHLARLAHIKLTDTETASMQKELASILDYVEKLQEVDTKDLDPTTQVTGLSNVTRKDEPKDYGTTPDKLLKNAPQAEDGYIKVGRVL